MEITGLDYNTQREKLKLKAYGRNIQQMVDICCTLPTKQERQRCAESIIQVMRRVVPSQQNNKERLPVLWYHLALMSDFKLDIDYPYEFEKEDKMAQKPEKIEYADKRHMPVKHYGRLVFALLDHLKGMAPGAERDALALQTARQMQRCLATWGMGTADRKRVVADMERFTNGVIVLDASTLQPDNEVETMVYGNGGGQQTGGKKKRKKK